MKTGRIVAHENLQISPVTIENKLFIACGWDLKKTAAHFTYEELQPEDFLSLQKMQDRATAEGFHSKHLTGYLNL